MSRLMRSETSDTDGIWLTLRQIPFIFRHVEHFSSPTLSFSLQDRLAKWAAARPSSSIRQPYAYRHLMLRQTFQIFAQPPAAASPQPDHFAFLAASRLSELFIAQKIKQPRANARPLRIIRKRFSRAAPTGILGQNLKLTGRRLPECDVFAGLVNKQGFPDFQSCNIFLCSFKRRNSRLRLYASYNFWITSLITVSRAWSRHCSIRDSPANPVAPAYQVRHARLLRQPRHLLALHPLRRQLYHLQMRIQSIVPIHSVFQFRMIILKPDQPRQTPPLLAHPANRFPGRAPANSASGFLHLLLRPAGCQLLSALVHQVVAFLPTHLFPSFSVISSLFLLFYFGYCKICSAGLNIQNRQDSGISLPTQNTVPPGRVFKFERPDFRRVYRKLSLTNIPRQAYLRWLIIFVKTSKDKTKSCCLSDV